MSTGSTTGRVRTFSADVTAAQTARDGFEAFKREREEQTGAPWPLAGPSARSTTARARTAERPASSGGSTGPSSARRHQDQSQTRGISSAAAAGQPNLGFLDVHVGDDAQASAFNGAGSGGSSYAGTGSHACLIRAAPARRWK